MEKDKSIDVLNTLIEINNDRIQGYETAAKETEEADLKTLFSGFKLTSLNCKKDLVNEVQKLGGKPAEGTKTSGKFYRAWMDVKAALTKKDRKAILSSCEYGEDVATETYDNAIKDHLDELTPEQQAIVQAQQVLIQAEHDKVKNLRDAAAAIKK